MIRWLRRSQCVACFVLVATTGSCREPSPAGKSARVTSPPAASGNQRTRVIRPLRRTPPVGVQLGSASVAWAAGTLTVECRVTLVNRTGRDLIALTNFNSVFDGFTVILRGPDGGLVARQSYVAHQSPYARDRPLPVPPGETTGTLRFPIELKAKPGGPFEVQLSGGIRGTRWNQGLLSKVVVARPR